MNNNLPPEFDQLFGTLKTPPKETKEEYLKRKYSGLFPKFPEKKDDKNPR